MEEVNKYITVLERLTGIPSLLVLEVEWFLSVIGLL